MNHPEIIDSTLREGEQAPGVAFTHADRRAVVAGLGRVGIDEIELGVSSPLHDWLPQLAADARVLTGGSCRLALWCRCREEDIAFAARCRIDVLSLSIPVSDSHICERLRKSRTWVEETLARSVSRALSLGIPCVSVGLEDASRAELDFVLAAVRTAEQHGARRIRLADTVGICSPGSMRRLVLAAHGAAVNVGVHCHNDFGMATANSIAALEAGASFMDASVLGLGERAGCCRLEEAAGYLTLAAGCRNYRTELLPELCHLVARAAGRPIASSHPLVGAEIFTCESGLHQHGLAMNPKTYEPYDPERVGNCRTLRFGPKSGLRAIALQLEKMGMRLDDGQAGRLACMLRSGNSTMSPQQLLRFAAKGGRR